MGEARRLAASAKGGEILVSESTFRSTRSVARYSHVREPGEKTGDLQCAADLLLKAGVSLVVIKEGESGSHLFKKEWHHHEPPRLLVSPTASAYSAPSILGQKIHSA